MTLSEFMAGFDRLTKWFGKKNADPAMWYERVRYIPNEAWMEVLDGVIDSAKFFPTPQDVKNAYSTWQVANPERMDHRHETWCGECGGIGSLEALEYHTGLKRTYTVVFRCHSCRNWEGKLGTAIPLATRQQIEASDTLAMKRPRPERGEDEGYIPKEEITQMVHKLSRRLSAT